MIFLPTAARTEAILVPQEALIISLHEVCCKKFLIAVVCRLLRIEFNGVEDNSLKSSPEKFAAYTLHDRAGTHASISNKTKHFS